MVFPGKNWASPENGYAQEVIPMKEEDVDAAASELLTKTIEITDVTDSYIESSLEVKPVEPEDCHQDIGALRVKERSSSFEALYDATQLESVSSSLPLPSSIVDSTPLVGDHFQGTFTKSEVTSSFEELYRPVC